MSAKKSSRRIGCSSAIALFTATFFFSFPIASAPHRVHHLFEKIAHSNSRGAHSELRGLSTHGPANTRQNGSGSGQAHCPIQQTVQTCQVGPVELVYLPFIKIAFEIPPIKVRVSIGLLNPSRFFPRAPPHTQRASSLSQGIIS